MVSKPPLHLADDRDPWERQPGESHRLYSRFRTFMELGRTRTLKQAAEMLHAIGDKVGYRTLQQYGYQFRWTERAEAHDRDQDRLERERLLKLRQEMLARHRKLASGLMAKAVAKLTTIQPADLTALDVVRFVRQAAALERAALGEPEQTVAVTGAGGGPVVVEDFGQYTPAERRARMQALAQEISRRALSHTDDDDE
jgi:hypothetical protein